MTNFFIISEHFRLTFTAIVVFRTANVNFIITSWWFPLYSIMTTSVALTSSPSFANAKLISESDNKQPSASALQRYFCLLHLFSVVLQQPTNFRNAQLFCFTSQSIRTSSGNISKTLEMNSLIVLAWRQIACNSHFIRFLFPS